MKSLYGVKVAHLTLESAGSRTAYTGARRKLVKIRMKKQVLLDGEHQDIVIEDDFYVDEILQQLETNSNQSL